MAARYDVHLEGGGGVKKCSAPHSYGENCCPMKVSDVSRMVLFPPSIVASVGKLGPSEKRSHDWGYGHISVDVTYEWSLLVVHAPDGTEQRRVAFGRSPSAWVE